MEYKLSASWRNIDEVIIYGFGKVTHDNLKFFLKNFHVRYIVDKDKSKCGCEYMGVPVVYFEDVKDDLGKHKIIISTVNRNAQLIKNELEAIGLENFNHFCSMEVFLTQWFWHIKRQVCLMEVHSTITTRCTLRCKHCNMFMPYYKKQYDYSAEDIINDLKLLFRNVDYIVTYAILGGEPLLNKELPQLIEKVGESFGEKIGNISIITNGMIEPSDELVLAARKYDVLFDFSDYTDVVNYREKFLKCVNIIQKAGIRYNVNKSIRWCDFGFPDNNCDFGYDELKEHMLSCGPIFHGLNDRKYYYCHISWSADKANLLTTSTDDYVDLEKLAQNDVSKELILKHSNGVIDKGFVKLCKICGGCGNDNKKFVKAAEQMIE